MARGKEQRMSIEMIKRKKGRSYRVRMWRDGKAICRTFKTRDEALIFEKDLLLNNGMINQRDRTFRDVAEEWLTVHASINKKSSGIKQDRRALNNDIYPFIGDMKVSRILPFHIDKIIANLKKRGIKNVTVTRRLCPLKTIFNYCIKRRIINYNPMNAIDNLRVEPASFKYWSFKDARIFLDHTRQKYSSYRPATYLLYLTALNTGMRQGELIALLWQDVDFQNRIITVRRSYSSHERMVYDTTKGNKIRHVPLNSAIYNGLYNAYRNREDCKIVFTWNGSYIDPHNLRERYFETDMEESGVERIRFHDIRHTFASHYMMNNGNLYDLQKILGHSTLRMTERYAHLSPSSIAGKGDIVSFTSEENIISVRFGT